MDVGGKTTRFAGFCGYWEGEWIEGGETICFAGFRKRLYSKKKSSGVAK
jgi:hypothetical protein